jgi:hypothetical protein
MQSIIKGLLEDDARLMYPALADIDPEDWEDASHYEGGAGVTLRRQEGSAPHERRPPTRPRA